jgi:hypothetical protein
MIHSCLIQSLCLGSPVAISHLHTFTWPEICPHSHSFHSSSWLPSLKALSHSVDVSRLVDMSRLLSDRSSNSCLVWSKQDKNTADGWRKKRLEAAIVMFDLSLFCFLANSYCFEAELTFRKHRPHIEADSSWQIHGGVSDNTHLFHSSWACR